jgi:hypothetical protein
VIILSELFADCLIDKSFGSVFCQCWPGATMVKNIGSNKVGVGLLFFSGMADCTEKLHFILLFGT